MSKHKKFSRKTKRFLKKVAHSLNHGAKKSAKKTKKASKKTAKVTVKAVKTTANAVVRVAGYAGRTVVRTGQLFLEGVGLIALGVVALANLVALGALLILGAVQRWVLEPVRIVFAWLSAKNRGSLKSYWKAHRPASPRQVVQAVKAEAKEAHAEATKTPAETAAKVETPEVIDLRNDDIVVELRQSDEEIMDQVEREVAETEERLARDEVTVVETPDETLVFLNDPEDAVGPDEVDEVFERRALEEALADPMTYDWDAEEPSPELVGIYGVVAQHADDPKIRAQFKGREYAARMYVEHPGDWELHIQRIRALMQTQLRSQQHIYPVKWLREGFDTQVKAMQQQQVGAGV